MAEDALHRIGTLYDSEREIAGTSAEHRLAVRQKHSKPHVEAFRAWCDDHLRRIPGKSDLAKAMRYALNCWDAFTLFLWDGRVAIDNNPAGAAAPGQTTPEGRPRTFVRGGRSPQRAMRPVALGRKNYLLAGSDAGGETLADAMTIIETAKLSGLNPEACLAGILARINDHPINRLDDLLPWNWMPPGRRQEEAT